LKSLSKGSPSPQKIQEMTHEGSPEVGTVDFVAATLNAWN
jgi:hypothetical protein